MGMFFSNNNCCQCGQRPKDSQVSSKDLRDVMHNPETQSQLFGVYFNDDNIPDPRYPNPTQYPNGGYKWGSSSIQGKALNPDIMKDMRMYIVARFQRKEGLQPTGRLDRQTASLLVRRCDGLRIGISSPAPNQVAIEIEPQTANLQADSSPASDVASGGIQLLGGAEMPPAAAQPEKQCATPAIDIYFGNDLQALKLQPSEGNLPDDIYRKYFDEEPPSTVVSPAPVQSATPEEPPTGGGQVQEAAEEEASATATVAPAGSVEAQAAAAATDQDTVESTQQDSAKVASDSSSVGTTMAVGSIVGALATLYAFRRNPEAFKAALSKVPPFLKSEYEKFSTKLPTLFKKAESSAATAAEGAAEEVTEAAPKASILNKVKSLLGIRELTSVEKSIAEAEQKLDYGALTGMVKRQVKLGDAEAASKAFDALRRVSERIDDRVAKYYATNELANAEKVLAKLPAEDLAAARANQPASLWSKIKALFTPRKAPKAVKAETEEAAETATTTAADSGATGAEKTVETEATKTQAKRFTPTAKVILPAAVAGTAAGCLGEGNAEVQSAVKKLNSPIPEGTLDQGTDAELPFLAAPGE